MYNCKLFHLFITAVTMIGQIMMYMSINMLESKANFHQLSHGVGTYSFTIS